MASRSGRQGMFLKPEEREKLKKEVEELDTALVARPQKRPKRSNAGGEPNSGDDSKENQPESSGPYVGTGCLVCRVDSDHAHILLCEGCNGEYHTYCLQPPLESVPEESWYCDRCKPDEGDGLEELVCSLPPEVTSRFGEICWAQGGVGFGWWPSCIYDPRLTVGSARLQARKNLGRKFLVYFFECHHEPFSVLPSSKILTWEEGLAEDLHLGRTAKSTGKRRLFQFRQAFQAATIEESKPVDRRLDWNHQGSGPLLPSPVKMALAEKRKKEHRNKKKRARQGATAENNGKPNKRARNVDFDSKEQQSPRGTKVGGTGKTNSPKSRPEKDPSLPRVISAPKQPPLGRVLRVEDSQGQSLPPVVAVEKPKSGASNFNPRAQGLVQPSDKALPLKPVASNASKRRDIHRGENPIQQLVPLAPRVDPQSGAVFGSSVPFPQQSPDMPAYRQTAAGDANMASAGSRQTYMFGAATSPGSGYFAAHQHLPSATGGVLGPNYPGGFHQMAGYGATAHVGVQHVHQSVAPAVDRDIFCKVAKQDANSTNETNIGFVKLPSRTKSTFADCRAAIESELDLPENCDWRFLAPNLGPMSIKQESKFGAIVPFLESSGMQVGDGSMMNPVTIVIVDAPLSRT